jgi:glycosyltransferase involved in cell wall biosynthesis
MTTSINNPLISIVTPVFNSSKFISETIESVLAQTYQNWEMIIVDDCSTDETFEIVLKYAKKDQRVLVFRMEYNSGSALCRNKAIELSQGMYLAFLDSDDLWKPEKLEKQLQFMQENDCDFSFTEYEHIDEEGKLLGIKARTIKKLTYQKLLVHCFVGCMTVMYRQDINNKIYGYNILKRNDYALFLRVMKISKNAMGISEILAKYRIRKNSLSRNKLKLIKYNFIVLHKFEHINVIFSCFYLFTNIIIKIFFKYKKIKTLLMSITIIYLL